MARENFEEALEKLEEIADKLESGDMPLEESLKVFEEGVRLSRFCAKKLDEAEKKIETLVKDEEGQFTTQPFPQED